ncbi:14205_t:CDS:1, partial [Racocetra persica]
KCISLVEKTHPNRLVEKVNPTHHSSTGTSRGTVPGFELELSSETTYRQNNNEKKDKKAKLKK